MPYEGRCKSILDRNLGQNPPQEPQSQSGGALESRAEGGSCQALGESRLGDSPSPSDYLSFQPGKRIGFLGSFLLKRTETFGRWTFAARYGRGR